MSETNVNEEHKAWANGWIGVYLNEISDTARANGTAFDVNCEIQKLVGIRLGYPSIDRADLVNRVMRAVDGHFDEQEILEMFEDSEMRVSVPLIPGSFMW